MWFIGVEVKQETSALLPKKKSWIRPCHVMCHVISRYWFFFITDTSRKESAMRKHSVCAEGGGYRKWRHPSPPSRKKKTFGKSLFFPGWFVARSVAARPHWSSLRSLLRTYERSTFSKSKTHKTRQKNSLFKFFLLQLNHRDKNSKEHTIIKCLTPYLKVQLCLGFQPRGNRAFALLRSMVTQV